MSNFYVDSIYVSMGINDLTYYDWTSKTCTLLYETPIELAFHLANSIRSTMIELHALFLDLPIVVNSLYDIDLAYYHDRGYYSVVDKNILDTAIDVINTEIVAINKGNLVLTPHISNVIHRYNKTKRCNDTLYHRLYDGLHPSYETQLRVTPQSQDHTKT